ncbi:MAG: NUDIX domain-containing protein [bacterium]
MELHIIQKRIIRELGFSDQLKFGEFLCRKDFQPDVFNYHLQTCVKLGLVTKNPDKTYQLSALGKSSFTNLDVTNNMQNIQQPKIVVQAFIHDGEQILLAKRKKHPFKDKIGFMSGKVAWGESCTDTLIRECAEEFKILPTTYKLLAIRRCVDYDKITAKMIFDAIYYIFIITEFKGQATNTEESECIWLNFKSIASDTLLPVTAAIISEYLKDPTHSVKFYDELESHNLQL